MRTVVAAFALLLCVVFLGCQQHDTTEVPPGGAVNEDSTASATEPVSSGTNSGFALDTVIVHRLSLLPDGRLATVRQEMTARDWSEPVQWSLTVTEGADTLLHRKGDSGEYEDLFREPALFEGCESPLTCKQTWFREDFLRPEVDTTSMEHLGPIFDDVATGSYMALGYEASEAARRMKQLKQYYADRPMLTVWFRDDPAIGGELLAYDPVLHRLVSMAAP